MFLVVIFNEIPLQSKRISFNLQHSVSRYCYGFIKEFLLKKNFSNKTILLKESITFVGEKQGTYSKAGEKQFLTTYFPLKIQVKKISKRKRLVTKYQF